MNSINLRESLNVISEVINNRPKAIREFDQIYMRAGDLLLQAEHVGHLFNEKDVIFIGDGDSIGLCLVHLHNQKIFSTGPKHVHVLDFDERIVLSVQHFAKRFGIEDRISSELYNVADPLPRNHWQKYQGFYTNPPFGQRNGGNSVEAFLKRGIEAIGENGVASVVIADSPDLLWTQEILHKTEKFMIQNSFIISELIPEFHSYHLDDNPSLRSCCISFSRTNFMPVDYSSDLLPAEKLQNFYGEDIPLKVKYVQDLTNGGKLISKDYKLIEL
jgi:predicted methyltransferase